MISFPIKKCDNCGGIQRDDTGKELVYLATKAVGDPDWLCVTCRNA